MNWVSSFNKLSEDFDKAMFASAMRSFLAHPFDSNTHIGIILDMMLMGAEISR